MSAFDVVRQFEGEIARFAGSNYCVAVNSGTSALFLAMKLSQKNYPNVTQVEMPCHTFISVPMAARDCGLDVVLSDWEWGGTYTISPFQVVDGALRFKRNMYRGGLHCLSFQARKILNIGEGGAVLTNDEGEYEWLRRTSYCGREAPYFKMEDIQDQGWNLYMTPEKAARGLHLMEYIGDGEEDQKVNYPDLRTVPYFNCISQRQRLRVA